MKLFISQFVLLLPCLVFAQGESVNPSVPQNDLFEERVKLNNFYLVADKAKNTLFVRSFDSQNKELASFRAISGANFGDKLREGDKKTPEGIYFVENKIHPSRLDARHGSVAYKLNYPNPYDIINKRSGHGIWIHGVENEARLDKRYDTLGCIALSNSKISRLGKLFTNRRTPIVVVDRQSAEEPIGVLPETHPLVARIHQWAADWSSKDVDAYLAYYHKDFLGRKMNYKQWRWYKKSLAARYKWIKITLSEVVVLRHGKYAVATFKQHYESDLYSDSTRKRLYLVGSDEKALILAEENVRIKNKNFIMPKSKPMQIAYEAPRAPAEKITESEASVIDFGNVEVKPIGEPKLSALEVLNF